MATPFYEDLKDILSYGNDLFYVSAGGVGFHHKPDVGLHVSEEELPFSFIELANTTCGLFIPDGLLLGTSDADLWLLPHPINLLIEDQTPYLVAYIPGIAVQLNSQALAYYDDKLVVSSDTYIRVIINGAVDERLTQGGGAKKMAINATHLMWLTTAGAITIYSYVGTVWTRWVDPLAIPSGTDMVWTNFHQIDALQDETVSRYTYEIAKNPVAPYIFQSDAATGALFKEEANSRQTHLVQQAFLDCVTNGHLLRRAAWSADGVYLAVTLSLAPWLKLFKLTGDTLTDLNTTAASGRTGYHSDVCWIGQVLFASCTVAPSVTSYTLSGDTLSLNNSVGTARCDSIIPVTGDYLFCGSGSSPYCHLFAWTGSNLTDQGGADVPPASGSAYDVVEHGEFLMLGSTKLYAYKIVGGALVYQVSVTILGEPEIMISKGGYLLVTSGLYNRMYVCTVTATSIVTHSTNYMGQYYVYQTVPFSDYQANECKGICETETGDILVFFQYPPASQLLRLSGTIMKKVASELVTTDKTQTTDCAWNDNYCVVSRASTFNLYKQAGGVDLLELVDLGITSPGGTIASMHWYNNYLAVGITSSPYLKLYRRDTDVLVPLAVPSMPGSPLRVKWSLNNLLFYRSGQTQIYVFTLTGDTLTAAAPTTIPIGAVLADIDTISNLVAVGHTFSPWLTMLKFNGSEYESIPITCSVASGRVQFMNSGVLFVGNYASLDLRFYNLRGGVEQSQGLCYSYQSVSMLCRVGDVVLVGGYGHRNANGGDGLLSILHPTTGTYGFSNAGTNIGAAGGRVVAMGGNATHLMYSIYGTAMGPMYIKIFHDSYPASSYAMALGLEMFYDQGSDIKAFDLDLGTSRQIGDVGGDVNEIVLTEGAGGVFGAAMVATETDVKFIRMSEV